MLHAKFCGNQSIVPEKIFEVFFWPYMGAAAMLVM